MSEANSFLKLDNTYKVQGEIPVSQNDQCGSAIVLMVRGPMEGNLMNLLSMTVS